MTKILSDKDQEKMYEALKITPEEAIKQIRWEYETMLRGERLESEYKPWFPDTLE